jgi:hypothetical protein
LLLSPVICWPTSLPTVETASVIELVTLPSCFCGVGLPQLPHALPLSVAPLEPPELPPLTGEPVPGAPLPACGAPVWGTVRTPRTDPWWAGPVPRDAPDRVRPCRRARAKTTFSRRASREATGIGVPLTSEVAGPAEIWGQPWNATIALPITNRAAAAASNDPELPNPAAYARLERTEILYRSASGNPLPSSLALICV